MNIKHCDICGTMERDRRIESFKIKKKWRSWGEIGWEYKDICTKCLNAISNAGRQDGN